MTPEDARAAGLAAGAVFRGEVFPVGTLVRWAGKNTKVTYRVTGIQSFGHRNKEWLNEITPLTRGPGRSVLNTSKKYLREVSE